MNDTPSDEIFDGAEAPSTPVLEPASAHADLGVSLELLQRVALLANEKKGFDIRAMRVLELVQYTDLFLVISARSDRQVKAIAKHIDDSMRVDHDRKPMSIEGTETNQWVIIDYGDIVVHIYYEPVRDFYELERLWSEAPQIELDLPPMEITPAFGAFEGS